MSNITLDAKAWNIKSSDIGAKPGDVIVLSGARADTVFTGLVGTPDNPITVTNSGPLSFTGTVAGGRGVIFSGCKNIRFVNTGADRILVSGAKGCGQGVDFRDFSSGIYVKGIDFQGLGYGGLFIKTDPICDTKTYADFILDGVYVEDCSFKGMKAGEAIYFGESHFHTTVGLSCGSKVIQVKEHRMKNVTVINCQFENIGRDAIQIGAVIENCNIIYNRIKNYGMTKEYGQGSGITWNPGSLGIIAFNTIDTGSGFGIIAQGRGAEIHHNIILNTGWGTLSGTGDGGGIMLATYEPADYKSCKIYNNTLLNINRVGVQSFVEVGNDTLNNNLIHMKVGTDKSIALNSSKTILFDVNNLKVFGDLTALKLDSNYSPDWDSPAATLGAVPSRLKPIPKPIVEVATIEVVDGVVYAVAPSGRYKLN